MIVLFLLLVGHPATSERLYTIEWMLLDAVAVGCRSVWLLTFEFWFAHCLFVYEIFVCFGALEKVPFRSGLYCRATRPASGKMSMNLNGANSIKFIARHRTSKRFCSVLYALRRRK